MKKLYSILLGQNTKNCFLEKHRLVYVVAQNEKEAKILAKKKWKVSNIHIDNIKVIDEIDGFKITLKKL